MHRLMSQSLGRLRRDERGLSNLEKIGIAAVIISILAFVPVFRGWLGDAYDAVFKQVDGETGETSDFSIAARGILITVVAIVAFIGTGFLVLYTNLGRRLAFLVTGAATFGWMAIGSLLFVIYAPRGLRPQNLEGLNAFQIRIPAIAVTLGSLVIFLMFVVALDAYEKQDAEG
jgi:Flp pilus assembly pilin Flp